MDKLKSTELNELRLKWQHPKTLAIIQRHMGEYARAGVFESYLACVDSFYPPEYGLRYVRLQEELSRLARAEVYLTASTMWPGDHYLERVNAETGFSLTAIERGEYLDTIVPVIRNPNTENSKVINPFTDIQAALVTRCANELQSIGLVRPLYLSDILK
jgi:hypothetical protein